MTKTILLIFSILIFNIAQSQSIIIDETKWHRDGPNCAWVQSLAMASSNPDVLYLGTYSKGIYKTTNGGETWTYCSTENLGVYDDTLYNSPNSPCWWFGANTPVRAIAVDPMDENHVLTGTLETGLYESMNGGENWQQVGGDLPTELSVIYINYNPNDNNDILLGTGGEHFSFTFEQEGGLYRSTDGGENWFIVEGAPHSDSYGILNIVRDPTDNDHIIIGVSSNGEPGFSWGIMDSFDNGNTWEEVTQEFVSPIDIAINPANPDNIWAAAMTYFFDFWLLESDDGGSSWDLCYSFEDPEKWVESMYADADFNLYIAREYDGDEDYKQVVLKSTDNGNSWMEVDKLWSKQFENQLNLHNSCQADPANTDNIYFGNYYGVFHSVDGGITTQHQNSGLMNSYILDIEMNPENNNIIYAAGDQGLWKSMDGGINWNLILRENVRVVKCDPQQPDTIYFGGLNLWRSYDGGTTLEKIVSPLYNTLMDIAIHPAETNILLYKQKTSNGNFVSRSTNYGESWQGVLGCDQYEIFKEIVIDPSHPDTMYAGSYRSVNKGEEWNSYFPQMVAGVDPQNSNIIYATYSSGGLYNTILEVSYDWGNTFEPIAEYNTGPFPGLNIYKFIIDEENPSYLFYSTRNTKIKYSDNGGSDWYELEGIYDSRVTDIIPMVSDNKFYIATYGDGVWIYDTTYITSTERNEAVEQNTHLKASPNPFSFQTNISYDITDTGLVNLEVYDMQGQLINTLVNENKTNGKYETLWYGKDKNGREVKKGLYLIRLKAGGNVRFCKVVLSK